MRPISAMRAFMPVIIPIVATLISCQFSILWSNEAAAQGSTMSISLSATFNGLGMGLIGGTYYAPGAPCPLAYANNCTHQFFSGTATVTGQVDIEPVSGQQNYFNISQTFIVTSPARSFTLSQQGQVYLDSTCLSTLLVCLSVNGFGATDFKGENVFLQPEYGGSAAAATATTLPIAYPGNFTIDSLELGKVGIGDPNSPTGGGYFYSGDLDHQSTCTSIGGTNTGPNADCVVGSVTGSATATPSCDVTAVAGSSGAFSINSWTGNYDVSSEDGLSHACRPQRPIYGEQNKPAVFQASDLGI